MKVAHFFLGKVGCGNEYPDYKNSLCHKRSSNSKISQSLTEKVGARGRAKNCIDYFLSEAFYPPVTPVCTGVGGIATLLEVVICLLGLWDIHPPRKEAQHGSSCISLGCPAIKCQTYPRSVVSADNSYTSVTSHICWLCCWEYGRYGGPSCTPMGFELTTHLLCKTR